MGIVYSVNLTRVSATPYHLRYLLEGTGEAGSTTIPNTGLAPVFPNTADLRYDALQAAGQGAGGLPLHELVATGVANQASARHSLLADATTNSPNIANLARANCEITMRTIPTAGAWSVDADLGVGASAGYPVLVITPPGDDDSAVAYLDIHLEHSIDDGPDGHGG